MIIILETNCILEVLGQPIVGFITRFIAMEQTRNLVAADVVLQSYTMLVAVTNDMSHV